jgi:cellulose synthase/poly-beta-1,6-N-acetylglucosamine synthase-like glycosyltransferase
MKTKIVYVLTSNEKDLLLEQLLLSLYSLKYHNPTADVYLVVDQDTFSSIKGCRTLIEEHLS